MGSYIAYDALFQGKRENENSYNNKYETTESRNIQHLNVGYLTQHAVCHANYFVIISTSA